MLEILREVCRDDQEDQTCTQPQVLKPTQNSSEMFS